MNIIDFKVSVILALIGTILTLLVSIFNIRLTRRRQAEKEHERQKKEQYNEWLGPGGLPPKDEIKAVRIARSEGRKVSLPSPSSGIVLLLLIFFVSSMSYFFIGSRPRQPVPNIEITIPTIIGGPTLDRPAYTEIAVITTMTAAPASRAESTSTPVPGITMVILPGDMTIPYTPIAQPPILTPNLVASASSTPIPPTFFPLAFTPTSTAGSPISTPSPTMTTALVTESLTGTAPSTSTPEPVAEPHIAAAPSASVTTSVTPSSVHIGENALVMVSLNNVPAGGYTSAEFTCAYDANLVAASNVVAVDLFGDDPAAVFNSSQNGSFILAIAGSNGNKATTSGTAFTFGVFGLQAGQTAIECAVRVSKGDGVLMSLPSTGTSLTVTGAPPPETPTPTATPAVTPTAVESPTATASTTMTPTPVTKSPTPTASTTRTPAPFVQLLSLGPLQTDTDCQARIRVQVSGSPATGQFHVWSAFFGSAGDIYPTIVLPLGANNYQVGLGRSRGPYFVWFEYDGTSSNIIDLICPGLIGIEPAPSFTPASFIETTSNVSLTPTLSPIPLLTATPLSISSPTPNPTLTLQAAFEEIDRQFQEDWKAYIAFVAPKSMELGDTFTINLLLDTSLSPAELEATLQAQSDLVTATPKTDGLFATAEGNLITGTPEPGQLLTSEGEPVDITSKQVEITNRMKAVLTSRDPDAFTLQALHNDPEQIVSSVETTKWSWTIIAKKTGIQTLDLVIYQLIKYDDKEFWPQVETYRADITVEVTATQWLENLDWKWIIGVVVSLLLIPAFWRWYDQRSKRNNSTVVPVSKYAPLKKYFMALPQPQRRITLTFAKIEEILKDGLPDSARRHKSWWANEVKGRHGQASAWLDASWKVKEVDLTSRRVSFMRV